MKISLTSQLWIIFKDCMSYMCYKYWTWCSYKNLWSGDTSWLKTPKMSPMLFWLWRFHCIILFLFHDMVHGWAASHKNPSVLLLCILLFNISSLATATCLFFWFSILPELSSILDMVEEIVPLSIICKCFEFVCCGYHGATIYVQDTIVNLYTCTPSPHKGYYRAVLWMLHYLQW